MNCNEIVMVFQRTVQLSRSATHIEKETRIHTVDSSSGSWKRWTVNNLSLLYHQKKGIL